LFGQRRPLSTRSRALGIRPDGDHAPGLRDLQTALQEGVKLRGYFVWSLMDNFELSFGFSKRFGVIRVDYTTQKRSIKDSGRWYADIIRRNGILID
jgi:beta-glucosidase/6-phospho-beta-glucosidase/beta-galactosidase